MKALVCNTCVRKHVGICLNMMKVYYECGSLEHLVRDFPARIRGHPE